MIKLAIVIPTWLEEEDDLRALGGNFHESNNNYHIRVESGPGKPLIDNLISGVSTLERGSRDFEWIMFSHDDVVYHDPIIPWLDAIPEEFKVIGLGGGTSLGHPDLHKWPFHVPHFARGGFISNLTDAESHGTRVTEEMVYPVTTLDGFCLIVRWDWYMKHARWEEAKQDGIIFHNYDNWLCLRTLEAGGRVGVIPVSATHHGGRTEVGMAQLYTDMCYRLGYEVPDDLHRESHRVLYNRFWQVLPAKEQP